MRPAPILWFERLMLLALAIDLLNNLAAWHGFAAGLAARGLTPNPIVVFLLCIASPALGLVLWYFVTRRASVVARWIVTILVLLGTLGFIATALRNPGAFGQTTFLVAALAELLKLAAIACLFQPAAAGWFARRGPPATRS
ncbi:hypothetical protein [Sphingomonas sp. MMS24-J13]|uniref:hypothetical protein n=1 Tax=Sphingomonas sp. MMS24-J13 TaxID=3238686 RepID=UPI00384ACBF2